jgi:hypothetical protein
MEFIVMVVSSDNVAVLKRTESKSDSLRNKGSSRHFTEIAAAM